MSVESNYVEIGSGEDNSIDWDVRFKGLRDIDLILLDYESLKKEIDHKKLESILKELRKVEASVPSASNFNSAFDLIEGCVYVDQEFFDPDMPTSSYWKKISAKESHIPRIISLIDSAHDLLKKLYVNDGIPKLIDNLVREVEDKKRKKEEETAQIVKAEFKSQVSKLLLEVYKIFEQKTGLHLLHPYLIDLDNEIVFVLTIHTSYKKQRTNLEKTVSMLLAEKYRVYEIEEASPPGRSYIPYFAGQRRWMEMGWRQNDSVLFHPNKDTLKIAYEIRDKFISQNYK